MKDISGTLQDLLCSIPVPSDELSSVRLDALKASLLKKYVPRGGDVALSRDALAKFAAFNKEISNFRVNSHFKRTDLFGCWKDFLYRSFYSEQWQSTSFNLSSMLAAGRCGPGTSLLSSDQSFYRKMFDSPLSHTDCSLLSFYRKTIKGNWAEAESLRNEAHGSQIVSGSRLTTVPKNATTHRTICVEPTLNMFYQLGAKRLLEDILVKQHGFSRTDQQGINKELAREGSLYGNYATLDLSMASDCLSLDLMKCLLPPDIFACLDAVRSRRVEIDGQWHELGMISTMGNGFTFHLMTLVFVCLVKALQVVSGVRGRFAVFGDDIIVETEIARRLVFSLNLAGFKVNADKSFITGNFRESCGGDYYKGHDVRGVYATALTSWADIYSLFNRLHFWSLRNRINLHPLLEFLLGQAKFRPVPLHSGFDSGFIITSDHLVSPKRGKSGGFYYHPLTAKPRTVDASGLCNLPGVLIAFLGGYVRNRAINLPAKASYHTTKRFTPNWDEFSSVRFVYRESKLGSVCESIRTYDALTSGLTSRGLSGSWSQLLSCFQGPG